ncbi:HlyD family type I secretion periplasmic adaptor subunit [Azospirillum picis]|uniref:Membrane fusion protein (MFP) family protein n=1 Tax=Azospirillum picis TaxID=488438 RepID=A0ABU0MU56_9PROT|nr:HlyD family type I secretion periplasmic adaptor subunit [Azospirillum picis]MBP2300903.1 HlyD family type I secretion membrane fusion protein [Azospirillum picis]MDQ0537007.1 HlyD family type I secretion membrane fusion protein [Azospirillum picis]
MSLPAIPSAPASLRGVPSLPPAPALGRSMAIAMATIVFGFGGFIGWAAWAQLDSAAVAPGVVSVESHRKTVQHLEGGIVKRVRVANGDRVRTGDVLIELDDTQARASYDLTLGQQRAALARQARLRAEAAAETTDQAALRFPATLLALEHDPDVARLLATQRWTFQARQGAHASALTVKRQALADLEVDSAALKQQETSLQHQLEKIREEIADTRTLLAKGLVPKPRVLALERAEAELQGRLAELRGRLARNGEAADTVAAQIADMKAVRQKEIAQDLEAVDKDLADLAQRLVGLEDVLRRLAVTAPQDGIVVNLQVFTVGGVIRAGEPLLDVVPEKDPLVVDARLNPLDIDSVHQGLPAQVRLVAFKRRTTPTIAATVIDVSADHLVDPSGTPYYVARLRLDPAELEQLPEVHLTPGMPVDALIIRGERSALDYLLSPITDGFAHAMREK